MKMLSPSLRCRASLYGVMALLSGLSLRPVQALEPRTWISLDGKTLDAELIKTEGPIVELKDKEGRVLKVPKSSLSFGDLDYIAEFAPPEKGTTLGLKPEPKAKIPNPAKEMKFSAKSLKKDAGEFQLGSLTLRVCEGPRCKIFYSKGIDPTDTAELAERLWHDTAFFHASFATKFKDRKIGIFLVSDDADFQTLGDWYIELLKDAKQAQELRAAWPKVGGTSITLPADKAEEQGLLTHAIVIRTAGRSSPPGGDNAKGVWGSSRTHALAANFLALQAGGISTFAKEGVFAIFTGHAYYKEISLTGASTSGVLQKDTGSSISAASGYDTGKNWAAELKRRIRKGDVKPRLSTLFASSSNDAKSDDFALAYSFSRFLQSTPERHTAYGKLMERISTSKQVPDLDAFAKIYGLEDAAAFEKEWLDYIGSGDFR